MRYGDCHTEINWFTYKREGTKTTDISTVANMKLHQVFGMAFGRVTQTQAYESRTRDGIEAAEKAPTPWQFFTQCLPTSIIKHSLTAVVGPPRQDGPVTGRKVQ